jgi:hypothetical protein
MTQTNSASNSPCSPLSKRTIILGIGLVESPGQDLPSGRNLVDYLDKKGRFDNIRFFSDHKDRFPNLCHIIQCEASRRVTEVGCERFFGKSGYISQPCRSRLGVRNYEQIALLSTILNCVYIDLDEVAMEYLKRCKRGDWKRENTLESLKCYNLERVIIAGNAGLEVPKPIALEDYVWDVDRDGTVEED